MKFPREAAGSSPGTARILQHLPLSPSIQQTPGMLIQILHCAFLKCRATNFCYAGSTLHSGVYDQNVDFLLITSRQVKRYS